MFYFIILKKMRKRLTFREYVSRGAMRYNVSAKRSLHAKLFAVSLRSTPCANCNSGVLAQLGFPQISLVLEYAGIARDSGVTTLASYYPDAIGGGRGSLVRRSLEYLNRKGVGKGRETEERGRGPSRKDRPERPESENRRTQRHYLARVRMKLLLHASCNHARFNAFDFRVRKCPPKKWLIIIFPLRDTRSGTTHAEHTDCDCRYKLPERRAKLAR